MKKILKYIFIALIPLVVTTSCKKDMEPVFDENATHRMDAAIADIYTVLEGNTNGWLIKYYPNALHTYGGFTLFAKFTSKTDVELTSDINSDVVASSYIIKQGAGPVLSFNTYNKVVHFFSEPGADSGVGSGNYGMEGDFEFLVLEYTAERVVLKGNKSGNKYEMYPLEAGEFDTLPSEYQAASELFDEFSKFELLDTQGEVHDIILNYRTFQQTNEGENPLLPFRIVPGGLEFLEEYDIDGQKVNELLFKEPTVDYPYGYYTNEGETIKIYPVIIPINQWFATNLWAMSYSNVGDAAKPYWNVGRTNLADAGLVLSNLYLGYLNESVGTGLVMALQDWASVGMVAYNFTLVAGTTDEVNIAYDGLFNLGNFGLAHWNAGLNYIEFPLGDHRYKIVADRLDKPDELMLIDVENPDNTYRIFRNVDIDDPLNN